MIGKYLTGIIFLSDTYKYYQTSTNIDETMKTIIQIHKEGKYYVATDLITNVADQGKTKAEAVANLKKGVEEHYKILMEIAKKEGKASLLDMKKEDFL